MVLPELKKVPKCTIDFPLEISRDEIGSLSGPINTLLRSSCLISGSFSQEESVQSLFDIAGEIADVEACGFLLPPAIQDGTWELKASRRLSPPEGPGQAAYLSAPAIIAAHSGKGVSFGAESGDWALPVCEAWGSRSLVAFPLRRERDIAGALVFGKKESHPFTRAQIKLLCVLSMQAETQLSRFEPLSTLSYYSLIDPLTHLYNRQYFDNQLEKEVLRSRRSGDTFSVMLFDLDGFTDYNDRFLTHSGDIALQEFADIMRTCMREVDTLARLGGDDFGVILLESDSEGAEALATRVIDRFQRHLLPGSKDARTERLSVSVGIAAFPSDSFDHADLIAKAGTALEQARSQGGGQACTFHDSAAPSPKNRSANDIPVRKIYDAGRSVVDMDSFLEILLFTGMQAISACRGSIVVKAPDGKNFSLRAAIGFNRGEEQLANSESFTPGAVTSWVVNHQLPLVVSRSEDSPVSGFMRKNGYQTDSFLSIPLTHAGKTLGAINLTHKKDDHPFTREDLYALSPIASEIASILWQGMSFRENVRKFSLSILGSLTDALELRYPFLSGHASRVRTLSLRTGERMGLPREELDVLENAAFLHDVGIVGVPSNILAKKRALNEREVDMMRKHPFLGAKLVEGVPGMEATKRTILEHHEHYDGSGYPAGLRGQDICLTARILGVAEYYDSIVSERPYRGGLKPSEAIQLVHNGGNVLFDQDVVAAFEAVAPSLYEDPGSLN